MSLALEATRGLTETTPWEQVLAYHERTRHHLDRYAAGPDTLDWSAQPDPFRSFAGAPRIPLPLAARGLATRFSDLDRGAVAPRPVDLASLGLLLELSLALSAWKVAGPDRWAVRCNPSSGNLHPTEAYVVCRKLPGLEDGVYHYLARDHVLEQRCRATPGTVVGPAGLFVGLSSVAWREAWKYGERAFRYRQLDTGHALGALRYAAASLGWNAEVDSACGSAELAAWLGLDRDGDYRGAEREDPELLLALGPGTLKPFAPWHDTELEWFGQANLLDPHPMYRWPVIDEVARASVKPPTLPGNTSWSDPQLPPLQGGSEAPAAELILQRRSAQRFDATAIQDRESFHRMLDALLPRPQAPWDAWPEEPRVHPVFFVHRVEGLVPGLYALPRGNLAMQRLRAAMHPDFAWSRIAGCPEHLPLFLLAAAQTGKLARAIGCHQAIASDCCVAVAMLADFDAPVEAAPWRYRQLHWEAGLLGQVLYLEAEAAGLRGTGIGCYFDEACHQLLGLGGPGFRSLYHFTVGRPLDAPRILSLPPYSAGETP
jgi:SagB-type dehydrogenase family enzyme